MRQDQISGFDPNQTSVDVDQHAQRGEVVIGDLAAANPSFVRQDVSQSSEL